MDPPLVRRGARVRAPVVPVSSLVRGVVARGAGSEGRAGDAEAGLESEVASVRPKVMGR